MKNEELFLDVIEYTNQAMLYELFTYPSFGLVSPFSTGSHSDMDYFTFIDSTSVLNKYMFKFACLGFSDLSFAEIYEKAVKIGVDCEGEMFEKTKGVNTHKGLIFVLGTLVCTSMKTLYNNQTFENIFINSSLLIKDKLFDLHNISKEEEILSNGEKIYLRYNIEGVRKEAYMGFPIIQKSLNVLNINDKESFIKTLIYIMSECDDTTIIHRLGLDELNYVKETMKNLFKKGFDIIELKRVEKEFIKKGISPGGSADLLCGTIFLSLIENKFKTRRKQV